MGWLRRSYRIGFVVAGVAAAIFVAAVALDDTRFEPYPTVAANQAQPLPHVEEAQPPLLNASLLTIMISGVTCLVSTVGAFSTMLLAWRLDRRQSQETALRIAQLQIEVERSRQVKVGQS